MNNIIKLAGSQVINKGKWMSINKVNRIEETIFNYAIDKAISTISYETTLQYYMECNNTLLSGWLFKYHKKYYNRIAFSGGIYCPRVTERLKRKEKISLLDLPNIRDGIFVLKHNTSIVTINKTTTRLHDDDGSSYDYAEVVIKFIGPNAKKDHAEFTDFIVEYRAKLLPSTPIRCYSNIYSCEGVGSSMRIVQESLNSGKYKSFENLFVSKDLHGNITNYIDTLSKINKRFDGELQLNGGILLYGKPGTGKTSLVSAIAKEYNYDIFTVDMSHIKDSIACIKNHLATMRFSIPSSIILLFEDIDYLYAKREDEKTEEEKENARYLLQVLDGFESIPDSISIATTNRLGSLDEAIIREGRFDLKLHIEGLDEEEAKRMCDYFNIDHNILKDMAYPLNPAYLKSMIIQKYTEMVTTEGADTITMEEGDE